MYECSDGQGEEDGAQPKQEPINILTDEEISAILDPESYANLPSEQLTSRIIYLYRPSANSGGKGDNSADDQQLQNLLDL